VNDDHAEILKLLEIYFDLLYEGKVDLIEKVFLPQAHVFSIDDDGVVDADIDAFRRRIAGRPSPASAGKERADRVLTIDILGPNVALAKVDLLILPAGYYADYLSLLKVNGRWRIISKVFHFDPAHSG
jgi:hypothetical protein